MMRETIKKYDMNSKPKSYKVKLLLRKLIVKQKPHSPSFDIYI